jgi:thiamine biosynthesis lipoprotein
MLTFEAMNTRFLITGLTQMECSEILALVQDAENTFSRFIPTSDISNINNLKGQWVQINPQTLKLLKDSTTAYYDTDGLFNPFLGEVMHKLGYDQSFEKLTPSTALSDQKCGLRCNKPALPAPKKHLPRYLDFDEQNHRVRLSQAALLDLGGIAKGWIAQQACDKLQLDGVSAGLIDAGGDIILWGQEPRQKLWGVGVAHPFEQGSDIADLWLEGLTAIATSSIVKRQWNNADNHSVHHIIDPRTKEPSTSDFIQVTILARNLAVAEQYAKCLLILGSSVGLPWFAKKCADLAYIAVCGDGRILTSQNLPHYCSDLEVAAHA